MTRDKPARSEDFDALYDLPDPRPYYQGLKPSGYAMPERAADAVRVLADGRPSFQLLDFACGYGAIGLLLRSRRRMADLYRRYDQPAEGDAAPADRAYFAADGASEERGWRIGGLDVAGRALAYAQAVGALDFGFCEDVLRAPPSPSLSAFLRETDLIVESGAIGSLLAPALPRLIAAAAPNRPGILYCPRPNVDAAGIAAALEPLGYSVEPLGAPAAYRKPLSEAERRAVAEAGAAHGRSPAEIFDRSGFMRVQMRLARPHSGAV